MRSVKKCCQCPLNNTHASRYACAYIVPQTIESMYITIDIPSCIAVHILARIRRAILTSNPPTLHDALRRPNIFHVSIPLSIPVDSYHFHIPYLNKYIGMYRWYSEYITMYNSQPSHLN